MDARRLRYGAMLAATLGVVGLALVLGVSRGGGEQAGAQGAVPTTTTATATPSPGSPLGDAPGVTLVTPTASPASTPPASSTPEISDDSHLGRRATPTPAPVLTGTEATAPTPATPTTATTPTTSLPANPPQCTAATLGGSRTANAALAGDCDTLLSIETTLKGTGQPWRGLNWEPGTALTGWKGVTVAGTPKRVTKLYLYASGLTGTIPTQVGDLTGLTELNLSWNQLTGGIPTQLGALTKLTKLYLYGNRLTGSIPTQVGALTKLRQLYLYGNRLTGSIPTQVGGLVELETLELAGNGLTGAIPTQLGSLTKLRQLELHTNRLTGVIPTQVGSLTKLTQLRLQGNRLSGGIPSELGSLTGLANLDLSRNRLTGAIPAELGSLTKLTALRLNGNALTGSIPTELGSLTKLRTLALSGNALTGCVPEALRRAATNDLARLSLSYCLKLIALSDGTAREMILEWTATATGVTSWQYRLQGPFFGGRTGDWGAWTTVVSGRATTRTYRLRNLANYKGYYVQVRGIGAGVNYISNEAVGVTPKVGSDGIPAMSAGAIYAGGRQYRLSGTHYVITIPVNARIMMGGAAIDDGVFIVSIIDTTSEKWMIIDSDTGTVLERPQRSRSEATGALDSTEEAVNDLFDQMAASIQRVIHP